MNSIKISWGIPPPHMSYEQCFQIAKKVGFDSIDFLPKNKHFIFPPKEILTFSKNYAIPITGIHSPIHLVPYAPQLLFPRMLQIIDYFPLVKTYVVHMTMVLNYLQNNPKKIQKLISLAKEKGVTVCFESNPIMFPLQYYPKETYVPHVYGDFCVKQNLSMTFDTSHIASVGGDIVEFYKRYYKNITMIHLSDFKNGIEHLPLGHGNLPLLKLFDAMKRTKKKHYLVFEIGTFHQNTSMEEKEELYKESILLVKNYW